MPSMVRMIFSGFTINHLLAGEKEERIQIKLVNRILDVF
jgi:hypothetical protein